MVRPVPWALAVPLGLLGPRGPKVYKGRPDRPAQLELSDPPARLALPDPLELPGLKAFKGQWDLLEPLELPDPRELPDLQAQPERLELPEPLVRPDPLVQPDLPVTA